MRENYDKKTAQGEQPPPRPALPRQTTGRRPLRDAPRGYLRTLPRQVRLDRREPGARQPIAARAPPPRSRLCAAGSASRPRGLQRERRTAVRSRTFPQDRHEHAGAAPPPERPPSPAASPAPDLNLSRCPAVVIGLGIQPQIFVLVVGPEPGHAAIVPQDLDRWDRGTLQHNSLRGRLPRGAGGGQGSCPRRKWCLGAGAQGGRPRPRGGRGRPLGLVRRPPGRPPSGRRSRTCSRHRKTGADLVIS